MFMQAMSWEASLSDITAYITTIIEYDQEDNITLYKHNIVVKHQILMFFFA